MYHFLLGGYDLEMLEIRKILEIHNQPFTDLNLSWGATLDAYQEAIQANPNHVFVGIELVIKDNSVIPQNYIEIDHHNEKAHLPASIEQLASVLGVNLTRHQQLVAANDKGYIPAMRQMGASEDEIEYIRYLDRQAQGVTEEMEQMALSSLKKGRFEHDVFVIETPLDKFSPIVDRLNQNKILIYNHETLNYYGVGINKLAESFKNLIDSQKAYHGGGDSGYFGTVAGAFSQTELNTIISQIIAHVADYP